MVGQRGFQGDALMLQCIYGLACFDRRATVLAASLRAQSGLFCRFAGKLRRPPTRKEKHLRDRSAAGASRTL